MRTICVIPARYKSSRFEGKPLADIHGKPMIWWVYNQAIKVKEFSDILIATDDIRIEAVCKKLDMNVIMTSENNKTPNDRIIEVASRLEADLYVAVLGDEPLIEPETIKSIIPDNPVPQDKVYVSNLMTAIQDPAEVIDFTNLKIVTDTGGYAMYISRSPIPYPKGTLDFQYKKFVGVSAFNKKALEFYKNTPRGRIETAEDNDFIRYLEHGEKVKFIEVQTNSLSVDTPKDLDRVRAALNEAVNVRNVPT